jgi:hypothetical protein
MKNADDVFVAQALDGVDRLQHLKRLTRSLRLLEIVWLFFTGLAAITPFFWGGFDRSAFLTLCGLSVAGAILSLTYSRVLVLRAIHGLHSASTQPQTQTAEGGQERQSAKSGEEQPGVGGVKGFDQKEYPGSSPKPADQHGERGGALTP